MFFKEEVRGDSQIMDHNFGDLWIPHSHGNASKDLWPDPMPWRGETLSLGFEKRSLCIFVFGNLKLYNLQEEFYN